MKKLSEGLKHGKMTLLVETLDDLWHLYNVISPGDKVYARTTREVKIEEEGIRPTKGKRIPVFLGIQADRVAFQKEMNRLRVTGVIFEAPERLGIKGSYHTISISTGKKVTIEKPEWPLHQLRRIKTACEAKAAPIVVAAIDDEECCVALLRHYGFDVKAEIRARLPGKLEGEKRDKAFLSYFKAASDSLVSAWNECRSLIAIVGPGFVKDKFTKYVRQKHPTIVDHIATVGSVSSGGVAGVHEALRCGILGGVAKKIRVTEETRAVEEVLTRIGSQRRGVSYGSVDVEKAVGYGAVKLMLVADELLRGAEDEERRRLEDLIRNVEKTRGRVMIVSAEHEAGKKLWGLGGVAALLRFPIA